MKLYHMPRTRSARVLWTAHEIGAEIEIVPIDLVKGEGQSPAHKERHPHGKLPAAEIDGAYLIESGAIALHLALRHGAQAPFLPDLKTLAGAKVLRWAFYAVSTLDDPTIDAYLQQRFAPEGKRDQTLIDNTAKAWKETIGPFICAELGDKPHLLGEFSFADVMVGYTAFFAGELGLLDDKLGAYVARLAERPGFKVAFGG